MLVFASSCPRTLRGRVLKTKLTAKVVGHKMRIMLCGYVSTRLLFAASTAAQRQQQHYEQQQQPRQQAAQLVDVHVDVRRRIVSCRHGECKHYVRRRNVNANVNVKRCNV